MDKDERLSRHLSGILDHLGYGKQMVEFRKDVFCKLQERRHIEKSTFRRTTVGSKGEGINRLYEADTDFLLTTNTAVCVEENIQHETNDDNRTKFCLKYTHPGYCILYVSDPHSDVCLLKECLYSYKDGYILPSRAIKALVETGNKSVKMVGPSVSCCVKNVGQFDIVLTIPCICPTILQAWASRPRLSGWPPLNVREKLSTMSGNVVATGLKGCTLEDLQWRLCFNSIELLLIDSLNDTQIKLYKILKWVKTGILQPKEKEITSFMMKNVVLWLAERYPQSEFTAGNLLKWTLKALRLLRRSIKLNYLPYYIIPERNLLLERVDRSQAQDLEKKLANIISKFPQFLTQCEKLKFATEMSREDLKTYGDKCTELEVLSMSIVNCGGCLRPNDDSVVELKNKRKSLLFSDWPPPVQQKLPEDDFGRLRLLLG